MVIGPFVYTSFVSLAMGENSKKNLAFLNFLNYMFVMLII